MADDEDGPFGDCPADVPADVLAGDPDGEPDEGYIREEC
jgi:hypothetical protein